MAEQYKDNTFIPKPNRFLVEEWPADGSDASSSDSFSQVLVIEKESTTPVSNTGSTSSTIDDTALLERLKALFPEMGVDLTALGTILKDYSYMKTSIEQIQGSISASVQEGSSTSAVGVGGLDEIYKKINSISSEIDMLKNNVRLAVESSNYSSIENYVTTSVGGLSDTFKNNMTTIAEQIGATIAEIDILRTKIAITVGEVDAEGIYTNASNDDKSSLWPNTVGVYDGLLQGFEYTDASGWVGVGTELDPYGLRFNGNQYITINNQMKNDTIYDQSFSIEAFITLRGGNNQKLTNLGSGMYLSDGTGLPTFYMNTGADEISFKGEYALSINSTLHVVYAFDAQLRAIQMYVNGTPYGGTVTWNVDESVAMPTSITVGQGMIADLYTFRVYDKLLSSTEVSKNFAEGITGVDFSRDSLIVNLEARKSQSLSKAIDNNRADIRIMKDAIVSTVTREEMNTAIGTAAEYVVIFSNENQTFATEYDGSTPVTVIIETSIDTFKGATRMAATISSPVLKNNLGNIIDYGTFNVVEPTVTEPGRLTWTIAAGTNISADYGWIEITVNIAGTNLLKKITWSKAKRGLTGPQGSANYRLEVNSSNGTMFMNGQVSTVLYVNVYYGDTEVTEEITSDRCLWTRTSDNASADEAWNLAHSLGSKSIYIDINDVYDRATFSCELINA